MESQLISRRMALALDDLWAGLARKRDQQASAPRPAVFLDRDGTINEEQGYLTAPQNLLLLPTAGEALRLLNQARVPVIVITNQSAIERGLMTLEDLQAVNASLQNALEEFGAHYDALYYCPHAPYHQPACECRKPQPGLLLQAAVDLDLDLRRSFVIGDKVSDLEAGRACGCRTVLVLTGYGEQALAEMQERGLRPDFTAANLVEAVRWILAQLSGV